MHPVTSAESLGLIMLARTVIMTDVRRIVNSIKLYIRSVGSTAGYRRSRSEESRGRRQSQPPKPLGKGAPCPFSTGRGPLYDQRLRMLSVGGRIEPKDTFFVRL